MYGMNPASRESLASKAYLKQLLATSETRHFLHGRAPEQFAHVQVDAMS